MRRMLRVGVALMVVCVTACSGAPSQAQTGPVATPTVQSTPDTLVAMSSSGASTAAASTDTSGTPTSGTDTSATPAARADTTAAATDTTSSAANNITSPTNTAQGSGTDTTASSADTSQGSGSAPTASSADTSQGSSADASQDVPGLASCDPNAPPPPPLPIPGSGAASPGAFSQFHDPLPPVPLYDPPGPKRVGLQAGHWLVDQVPPELHGLQPGTSGGGKQEWQVNLDVAQRTAAVLEASGIQTDVLPSTPPPRYEANAFVAIHADGDTTGADRGFKVAGPGFSAIPDVDGRLVDAITQTYGAETELPRDDAHISLRMRYYYAFNARRYCHAVAPGVPQAIIELAYLTNATDRQYLIGDPQRLAQALADGIQSFLATTP
ncbi:MAG: N-acetylmuramoyl-L-alanine amidase [Chloroflexi bacterium]|nr:N-acetylmuramoyl-L-alanine amidase [Chloroflexota bacterium]